MSLHPCSDGQMQHDLHLVLMSSWRFKPTLDSCRCSYSLSNILFGRGILSGLKQIFPPGSALVEDL